MLSLTLNPQGASQVSTVMAAFGSLLAAARPKQWIKNLLLYLAVFFTANEVWYPGDLGETASVVGKATLAVLIFSMLSGAMYILNDVVDAERDRRHPKKRLRPIASGRLSIPTARYAAALLTAVGLAGAFALGQPFGWISAVYVLMMLAYSLALKQIVMIDVAVISAGFVLRAAAGAAAIDAPISNWLYLCAGLGALFIALCKRRGEIETAGAGAPDQRSTLAMYTPALLDRLIIGAAMAAAAAYALYTLTAPNLPSNNAMLLTVPLVLIGLGRYAYLVKVRRMGESPEDMLTSDVPLAASVFAWLAMTAAILIALRGQT